MAIQAGKRSPTPPSGAAQGERQAIEISDAELEGCGGRHRQRGTGEVILEANEGITPRVISMAQENGIDDGGVLPGARRSGADHFLHLKKDPIHTHEESLIEIYPSASGRSPRWTARDRSSRTCSSTRRSRLLARRPPEAEHEARPQHAARRKILHPQDFYEVIKCCSSCARTRQRG
jgi:hypothetical protein